jgi:hypothetical protein
MKKIVLYFFISFLFLCFSHGSNIVGNQSNAHAREDWKQEYETVCAKSQNAMTLSSTELKNYIVRCDKLQDRISEPDGLSGATERKVYTKRLKMCRDLYDFALEYKEKNE